MGALIPSVEKGYCAIKKTASNGCGLVFDALELFIQFGFIGWVHQVFNGEDIIQLFLSEQAFL